jgi:transcriptional accessory protein Tex/SPT6
VKVGQKVKVTVMSVDLERGRIALTMRSEALPGNREQGTGKRASTRRSGDRRREKPKPPAAKPTVPKPGTIAPNGMRFR